MASSRPRAVESSDVIGIPPGLRVKTRQSNNPTSNTSSTAAGPSRDALQFQNQHYSGVGSQSGRGGHDGHHATNGSTRYASGRERERERDAEAATRYTSRGSAAPSSAANGPSTRVGVAGSVGQSEGTSLQAPFPPLASGLSADEIRECAYELFVGMVTVRNLPPSNAAKKGGVISDEMRAVLNLRAPPAPDEPAAKVSNTSMWETVSQAVRRQLDISEISSQRTRKALSRVVAAQAHKRPEAMIVPLELLQELGPTDFPSMREYQRWRKRQLLALEEGLLHHPARSWRPSSTDAISRDKERERERTAAAAQKLQMILNEIREGRIDVGQPAGRRALKEAVVALAERPIPGGSKVAEMHWADGTLFSTRLYAVLLNVGFTGPKETSMIVELEEYLEALGRIWPVLGMGPITHRAVFGWLFFRQYFSSGEKEPALLVAADFQMRAVAEEVARDLKGDLEMNQEAHVQVLLTLLPHMVEAGQAKLLAYHETFPDGNMASGGGMDGMVGVVLRASQALQCPEVQAVLQRCEAKGALAFKHGGIVSKSMSATVNERVDGWVRTSVKASFKKAREGVAERLLTYKGTGAPPQLVALAADVGVMALDMIDKYCETLKQWHSNAGGITVATLHSLYRSELRHYLSDRTVLSVEMTQVLLQAEKLEKQLIELAVEECADSEDGGAEVIQEMLPYETQKTIETLLQHWQDSRLNKYSEWVERSLQMEKWDPKASKAFVAPSLVEVMGLLDESLESFFALPLPPRSEMLVKLVHGMEKALLLYCKATIKPAGSRSEYIPPLPPLTRYKKDGSEKDKGTPAPAPPPSASKASLKDKVDKVGLARILVRINTLFHIQHEVEQLANRIRTGWENALAPPLPQESSAPKEDSPAQPSGASFWSLSSFTKSVTISEQNIPLVPPLPSELIDMFENVKEDSEKGITRLCEVAAFRVVYKDLREPLLEVLYAGSLTHKGCRLGSLLERLHPHLVTIADVINEKLRNRMVLQLLHGLVHGYQRVLLGGGPSRTYMIENVPAMRQDLGYLAELFLDGGDGLPKAQVEAAMKPANDIVDLMSQETEDLMRKFEAAHRDWLSTPAGAQAAAAAAGGGKGATPVPPVPSQWDPNDANTILRVLCYRGDRKASKYLKKLFDLPKEVKGA